ncbi:hypothetical protein [Thiomicrospira pelophila]|uniref:hypothetical protein n=1 Tax=Thiomicrospira pelophila TaxID=934 RepID=UPI0004A6CE80|nr:hypothetical protein [Thiomicrospira pelophila]
MFKSIFCRGIVIFLLSIGLAVQASESIDGRISLNLTEAEKAEFLTEMQQMLGSIQGVIQGIADDDPDKIIKAARVSGNQMARATPDSVRAKLDDQFRSIGGPTHMMFEELVIRAETDPADELLRFTANIMNNCMACHAKYKVN